MSPPDWPDRHCRPHAVCTSPEFSWAGHSSDRQSHPAAPGPTQTESSPLTRTGEPSHWRPHLRLAATGCADCRNKQQSPCWHGAAGSEPSLCPGYRAMSCAGSASVLTLAKRIQKRRETVVVYLLHQRQQAPNFSLREAVTGKPVQVMARQIRNQSPLVFSIRHFTRQQQQ